LTFYRSGETGSGGVLLHGALLPLLLRRGGTRKNGVGANLKKRRASRSLALTFYRSGEIGGGGMLLPGALLPLALRLPPIKGALQLRVLINRYS